MEKLKLLKGDFACKLSLALAPTIKAGFPSPADDYLHDSLDFNRDLIKNPEATFYGLRRAYATVTLPSSTAHLNLPTAT